MVEVGSPLNVAVIVSVAATPVAVAVTALEHVPELSAPVGIAAVPLAIVCVKPVIAVATKASVARSVLVSPGDCVVPVVPFGNAGVPLSPPAVPDVLAALFGMSALTSGPNEGVDAVPEVGPRRNVLAVCVLNENACVPLALIVVGDADINEGSDQTILPMPLPDPLKVQVVVVHDTPGPVKVNAPVVELIEVTPPPLPVHGGMLSTPFAKVGVAQLLPVVVKEDMNAGW